MGTYNKVDFRIVYINGGAAVSNSNFEAPDGDHIDRNIWRISDLEFKMNFKILSCIWYGQLRSEHL